MSELDDLRRVAYGRASGPVEEAAAADARAMLAEREALQRRDRAEGEAAEFARARSRASARSPEPEGEHTGEPDGRVTLTIVDPRDEPSYPRRLAATWRVWIVPAFAAFVLGVVLTVASGVLVLNSATRSSITPNTSRRFLEGSEVLTPGDLALASALLAKKQTVDDVMAAPDPSFDAASTHLLRSTTNDLEYAAVSSNGDICLVSVRVATGDSIFTCAAPTDFAATGLNLQLPSGSGRVSVHWNGIEITETPAG